jgi:NarL family two-component system sensor histidine kinase YdfH
MQLEVVDSHLTLLNPGRAQEIVQQSMLSARETLARARSAINNLRVEETDLARAMQEEIDRFITTTGIPCTADLAPLATLPIALQEHALRAISEGLTNVARHAQARHAWIRVLPNNALLDVEVGDDGIGFDPAEVAKQTGHYGLLGLRERARLIGGYLDVVSQPGKGTTLHFHLPTKNAGVCHE